MSQQKDDISAFAGIAYLVSVALFVLGSNVFYVSSLKWAAVMVIVLSTAAFIIKQLVVILLPAKKRPLSDLGIANIVAAVAIHPWLWLDFDKRLSASEQFAALRFLHTRGIAAEASANAALHLAQAVQYEALLNMKLFQPWQFWLHPASVVLLIWGVVMILYKEKTDE